MYICYKSYQGRRSDGRARRKVRALVTKGEPTIERSGGTPGVGAMPFRLA